MMKPPSGKISRQKIADEFSVTTRTVIRWEEYGFLPKGQTKRGYGPTVWYELADFEKLKKKMKDN